MKKLLKYLLAILLIVVVYLYFTIYPKFDIVSGFSAKSVASHYFIAGRDKAITEARDNDITSMNLASNEVFKDKNMVTSSVYGFKKRKAVFTKGLGVILLPHGEESPENIAIPNRNKTPKALPYPYGILPQKDTIFSNVDYNKIKKAVENAFDKSGIDSLKTRSVLVIYKDQIIGEKYRNGFDKNSVILGWSMTKSITSAIVGILEKQGKVKLNQNHLFTDWKNDDRKNITLKNLLNMNSGLAWDEDYNNISDVTKMLFLAKDMGQVQIEKQFSSKPNESWNYSSGTTNLISKFIKNQFNTQQEYVDFWYKELIDKIGMHSMLIETDLSGTFVGSSYGWATTRDWAKFGLLYLHNGNWNGEQILNKSWINFSKTPTNTSKGEYGGQFWLNAGGIYPDVPRDLFSCNGYQGQRVFIIPSKDLVIVKTGLTKNSNFDYNKFLREVIDGVN